LARVSEEPVAALKTYSNGAPAFSRKDSLPIEKLISTSTTPRGSVDVGNPLTITTANGHDASAPAVAVSNVTTKVAPRASSPLKQSHINSFAGKENIPMSKSVNGKALGIVDETAMNGNVGRGAVDHDGEGEMKTVEI